MKKVVLFLLVLAACGCTGIPAYKNPSLTPEKRVKDLLSRMTVEEKLGQLLCPYGWPMYERLSDDSVVMTDAYREFVGKQYGGSLWGLFRADPWTEKTLENGLWPEQAVKAYNLLQHYAVDSTRLGIPIILAEEAPHGHMAIGTTVFPTGIGLASTWDRPLMEEVGRTVAAELRAVGAGISYGPVIDLSREPRWSRVEETYGEDVYLTSRMAGGVVHGMAPKHNGWDKGVAATLKHFIAYGVPQGGHNGGYSVVGENELREHFLPTFKAAIDEGALSVMTAYNSIDGIPCTSNEKLLRGVLRGEWGFDDGIVVSDLISIDGLAGNHHVAASLADAGELALKSGVDVDLGANCYSLLKERVENGSIPKKLLDEAVGRVLLLKFRLGLFDNPYLPEDSWKAVRTGEHCATALQVAREGVILLENNGILPLDKGLRVAVVGPNADMQYNQLGDYTAPQPDIHITTPLEGIRAKIGASRVTYAKGCGIRDTENDGIAGAVRAARGADVTVVFVGGSSARDFGTQFKETGAAEASASISDMEAGEGFDRSSLELMGLQQRLLEALKATGKPLVVVYIEGRPLDKRWASENADALLTQFYPGQAGGDAIADVLFGDYNPAGRLPVSVPLSVGQIPVYYNQPRPAPGDYIDLSSKPLYSFGYGLSYTEFSYDAMECEPQPGGGLKVTVTVTNAGSRDGDEVVQVYVTDPVASTVRPRLQLRGFARESFSAGETRRVEILLDKESFPEPGEFIIRCGPSSDRLLLTQSIER